MGECANCDFDMRGSLTRWWGYIIFVHSTPPHRYYRQYDQYCSKECCITDVLARSELDDHIGCGLRLETNLRPTHPGYRVIIE